MLEESALRDEMMQTVVDLLVWYSNRENWSTTSKYPSPIYVWLIAVEFIKQWSFSFFLVSVEFFMLLSFDFPCTGK